MANSLFLFLFLIPNQSLFLRETGGKLIAAVLKIACCWKHAFGVRGIFRRRVECVYQLIHNTFQEFRSCEKFSRKKFAPSNRFSIFKFCYFDRKNSRK